MSVYLICYAASFLFARAGYYKLSGLVLIMAAVHLYWYDYRRSGNLIHLRGLFSLFWVGGEGISCLKLSKLQTEWSLMTWVCFLLALMGFWFTFEVLQRLFGEEREHRSLGRRDYKGYEGPLFLCILAVTVVSVIAFVIEALVLGFIPLFTPNTPHAYSTFHITGLHYFTVSCVLVPPLSVVYTYIGNGPRRGKAAALLCMNVAAFAVPFLCVSRFQLILMVGLAFFVSLLLGKSIRLIHVVCLGASILAAYLVLTVARGHSVSYLNDIFAMKDSRTPIFITQPYMYIANNYDNFNCLVEMLEKHTFGLRMLFPLWALTGLKFLAPSLVNFPIYVTKKELTTVTLFYDAYYDFGVIGVVLLSCALGAVCYLLVSKVKKSRNPVGFLFYAQMGMYMMLSFFTTWFSNPATWFYLVVTGMIYGYCYWKGN